jgi:hypothetical protein
MRQFTTPVRAAALAVLIAIMTANQVSAHHGTGASYDASKQVTVTGKVTEFLWRNPHSALFIDAVDENGAQAKWSIEMNSPGVLTRAGWSRRTFVVGDTVRITVHPSRAGTPVGVCLNPCAVSVNGKELSAREP